MKLTVTSKFYKDCRDFFLTQVGVDLEDLRNDSTRQFDHRNMLNIDWSAASESQKRLIQQAANLPFSDYKLVSSGSWMKSIYKK